ncbi:uncharacterized protein LOC106059715 isoform X3 [Biomphalaria glabrata]|uniref:Uncharacterized protein LOC106059715 isoform X3 n=1 Tax=Biomphalaria glabrata TaxID=6526 RepID=A0A9W3BG54_BIOGL|nr:uncharacterized protein LOC106059715 isoform X3 [Biomphalaria glabrata]
MDPGRKRLDYISEYKLDSLGSFNRLSALNKFYLSRLSRQTYIMDATEFLEIVQGPCFQIFFCMALMRLYSMLNELKEKITVLESKIDQLSTRCCCNKIESIKSQHHRDFITQNDPCLENKNAGEKFKEISNEDINHPNLHMIEENPQFIGHHELQISEGGEADLTRHLAECKKNPDHLQFIPVHQFNLDHLPESHRDLYDLIKVVADLTVRISVKMISERRPQFWPNTELPYCLSDKRGNKFLRIGSGCVIGLVKNEDEQCSCSNCQSLDRARSSWKIKILTATHVVFDDIEASETRVRLFFDSEDSPKVVFDRVDLINVSTEMDICRLDYNTCDISLVEKLDQMCKRYSDVRKRVFDKYNATRDEDKLMFIVSHPHGCSKQISIGRWNDKIKIIVTCMHIYTAVAEG